MRVAELILIVVQTLLVFATLWIARATLKQAADSTTERERERLARRLSDCADVLADLAWELRTADSERAARHQIRLRALLVGAAGYAELPRTFDAADAPVRTSEERMAALPIVEEAIAEVRALAERYHRMIVRVTVSDALRLAAEAPEVNVGDPQAG
jgi:hypothetical protein